MREDSPFHHLVHPRLPLSRREFLWRSGGGLGAVALASLLDTEGLLASAAQNLGRTEATSRLPHYKPRAKRVVQLFMAGAASHIDLFDFKPELIKRDGEKS